MEDSRRGRVTAVDLETKRTNVDGWYTMVRLWARATLCQVEKIFGPLWRLLHLVMMRRERLSLPDVLLAHFGGIA